MKKKILADLHTHSVFSLHAYSTLKENLTMANERGMKYMAITDHVIYDNDDWWQRKNEMRRFKYMHEVKPANSATMLISGAECNVYQPIDKEDTEKIVKYVPWRLCGVHSDGMDVKVTEIENIPYLFENECKAITVKSITGSERQRIKPTAFAHIERKLFKAVGGDNEKAVLETLYNLVDIAIKYDIFLEINNASLMRGADIVALMRKWVVYAKEKNAKFCLGTDAHYCDYVGDFTLTEEFLEQMDMEKAYILNYDDSALREFVSYE